MAPGLAHIQSRLTTTQALLLERSRVVSLALPPSASSTAQISRNLLALASDLTALDNETKLEAGGLSVGGGSAAKRGASAAAAAVAEAWERYDQLVDMFEEDDVGRERAKALKRARREVAQDGSRGDGSRDGGSRDVAPSPTLSRGDEEDTTPAGPFRDEPEEDGFDHHHVLAQQQQLMHDQDERLDLLSHSIGRQNHLSIQIGSELDTHHDLLQDTDMAMDRTAARLQSARRRLDRVADEAKQHGSTITIVGLIFILLILVIVFKT